MREEIKVNLKSGTIRGHFRVAEFKDHDSAIAYVPSLDLSAYGDNKEEAYDMLIFSIQEYFKELLFLNGKDLDKELEKYGWKRSRYFRKKFENNAYIDKEGILKNFNLSEDTPFKEEVLTV